MFKLALKRKNIHNTLGAFSEVALNRSYLKKIFLAIFSISYFKNIYGFIALNKNERNRLEKIVKKKKDYFSAAMGINNNKVEIYEVAKAPRN